MYCATCIDLNVTLSEDHIKKYAETVSFLLWPPQWVRQKSYNPQLKAKNKWVLGKAESYLFLWGTFYNEIISKHLQKYCKWYYFNGLVVEIYKACWNWK